MINKYIFALLFSLLVVNLAAQTPTPAPPQSESILIVGATAHLGNGDKIDNAAIGFDKGKITFVGRAEKVDKKAFARVIDAKGKHVYPGFIAPNSTLGLQEIGAVRATRDQYETGIFNPNVRSAIAFQTESDVTPTVRTNGVLLGQITPRGGIVSGSSSVMHFDGWNWEDAVIKMDEGIHMNWPRMYRQKEGSKKNELVLRESYPEQMKMIKDFFAKAQAYPAREDKSITDLKLEAMKGVFNGKKTLYVHAQDVKQITEAVNFKREMDIDNMVIVGGYDSWMVADMLRENKVGVMLRRTHSLPRYDEDDTDLSFKLPKLLQDEGVLFCFENAGDMEQMNTRNLPFLAGTAVGYGLNYEQAVMALTLNAAKMLGVDDRLGSLQVGKDATLFISEGDALDMMTNEVSSAFIGGKDIELDNRQLQLYRKYKAKYEQQSARELD